MRKITDNQINEVWAKSPTPIEFARKIERIVLGYDHIESDCMCKICGKELAKVSECAWTSCPK